ncbi:helix-turn-helix transcriptional regulator [Paenibacillus sp. GCM10027626]|uniref:helix-turn-helix transcriptional regulator n=1 Tax=Paenibacillus sp. GCM10027626 TaxID=3273411 RepID=UPI00362E65AF
MEESSLSTREHIIHMLKTNGELSAKTIAEQLGITGMAVRRHIDALERDGYIDSRTLRQAMGRPTAMYRLTPQADKFFPKKYQTLALDLLGELGRESGDEMINLLFQRRQEGLFNKYTAAMHNKDLADRVSQLARIQNENGYMVHYEQEGPDEFVLQEYNCPISDVANEYGQACQCELNLFRSLLGADVTRTECLAKGGQKCVYRIKRAKEKKQ